MRNHLMKVEGWGGGGEGRERRCRWPAEGGGWQGDPLGQARRLHGSVFLFIVYFWLGMGSD